MGFYVARPTWLVLALAACTALAAAAAARADVFSIAPQTPASQARAIRAELDLARADEQRLADAAARALARAETAPLLSDRLTAQMDAAQLGEQHHAAEARVAILTGEFQQAEADIEAESAARAEAAAAAAAAAPAAASDPAAPPAPTGAAVAPATTPVPPEPGSTVLTFPVPTPGPVYPLGAQATVIGWPFQGSHLLFGNWESDNAVDLAVPVGTPVYAVTAGTIGPEIGPLDSTDPHLQGLRLHLVTADDEYYYAHLSTIVVAAGQSVTAGQLLGYSGEANGVAHLHLGERATAAVEQEGLSGASHWYDFATSGGSVPPPASLAVAPPVSAAPVAAAPSIAEAPIADPVAAAPVATDPVGA